jgi:uncharacterized protein (TIGR02145 family)
VKAPTITPAGGSFTAATQVTIAAPLGTVEYQIGSGAWTAYTGAITVSETSSIKARATYGGKTETTAAAASFTVTYEAKLLSVKVDGLTKTISGTSTIDAMFALFATSAMVNATASDAGAKVSIGTGAATTTSATATVSASVDITVTNGTGASLATKVYKLNLSPSTETSGSFIDSRDSRTYKAVKIGTLWWMAENLKYTAGATIGGCSNGDPANCTKFGRNYTWTEAAAGVCPSGWHFSKYSEWRTLKSFVGGDSLAQIRLVAKSDGGTDDYGFGAVIGGSGIEADAVGGAVGWMGDYWTSQESGDEWAWSNRIYHGQTDPVMEMVQLKIQYYSVRCVQNY